MCKFVSGFLLVDGSVMIGFGVYGVMKHDAINSAIDFGVATLFVVTSLLIAIYSKKD